MQNNLKINSQMYYDKLTDRVFRSKALCPSSKLIYSRLLPFIMKNGGRIPRNREISDQFNLSTRTVQRAIKRLINAGLLVDATKEGDEYRTLLLAS